MDREAFERATDERVAAWTREWVRAKPTGLLYHYTDSAGFLGMLSSRKVWATDARFMNDHGEGAQAFPLIREAIARRTDGLGFTDEELGEVVGDMTLVARAHRAGAYLACFSTHGDVLSQWRAYADDGLGFAVGIDPKQVPTSTAVAPWPSPTPDPRRYPRGPILFPVIYGEADKRRAVDQILSITFPPDKNTQPDLAMAAGRRLVELASRAFKSEAFAEEREWRLVWLGPFPGIPPEVNAAAFGPPPPPSTDVPLRFRKTRHGFAPYLDWPIGNAVRSVVLGPKHTEDSLQSVRMFLEWNGYPEVTVARSLATYR